MILFIGHEASYTGAPKILLNFIKWLIEVKHEKIEVILQKDGPLLKEYQKVAKTYLWKEDYYYESNIIKKIINYFFNKPEQRIKKIIKTIQKNKPDLIFCNTIVNGEIIHTLKNHISCPVITRIPELETVIKLYNKQGWADKAMMHTDHFIAVSQAVKQNLIDYHNINTCKIDVCYGFIPSEKISDNSPKKNFKSEYQIPLDSFIVGGCGTLIWRKGFDLFLQVAYHLVIQNKRNDIFFLWVGGDKKSFSFLEFEKEIEMLGLKNNVIITGEVEDAIPYYQIMNVFLMTSREDPFPLVNLEAAQNGLPIICFDQSGGSPEFVTKDIGFVVEYAEPIKMAQKVMLLKENALLLHELAENAKTKAKQFTLEFLAPAIYNIMNKYKK